MMKTRELLSIMQLLLWTTSNVVLAGFNLPSPAARSGGDSLQQHHQQQQVKSRRVHLSASSSGASDDAFSDQVEPLLGKLFEIKTTKTLEQGRVIEIDLNFAPTTKAGIAATQDQISSTAEHIASTTAVVPDADKIAKIAQDASSSAERIVESAAAKTAELVADAADKMDDIGTSSTRLSYYEGLTNDIEERTSALTKALEDTNDKIAETMQANAGSVSDVMDDVKINLKSYLDGGVHMIPPPESILKARDQFADAVTKQFSSETLLHTKESLAEFGNNYVSSLDSAYHLSETYDALTHGKILADYVGTISKTTHDLVEAMDFKQNTAILMLIATFFWGSDQRRVGLERGKSIADIKISALESQLKAAKDIAKENRLNSAEVQDLRQLVDAANQEKGVNVAEVEDLRQKMDDLQAQVQALTAVAEGVTKQLEQARAMAPPPPPPETTAAAGAGDSEAIVEINGSGAGGETQSISTKSMELFTNGEDVEELVQVVANGDVTLQLDDESVEILEKNNNTPSTNGKVDADIVVPEPPKSIEVNGSVEEEQLGVDVEEEEDELDDEEAEVMEVENKEAAPPVVATTKTPSKVKGAKVAVATATPSAAAKKVNKKKKKKITKKIKKKTIDNKSEAGGDDGSTQEKSNKTTRAKASTKKTKVKVEVEENKADDTETTTHEKKKKKTIIVVKDDWGRLSESTLKRKTVKQLTGYLTEKGVQCTDDNGKILRKDSLVGLVLSN